MSSKLRISGIVLLVVFSVLLTGCLGIFGENVNKDELNALITEAKELKEKVSVGAEPGQASEKAHEDFATAITAAEAINAKKKATLAEVEEMVETLQSAITTFQSTIIPVEDVDKTDLNAIITAAEALLQSAKVGWEIGAASETEISEFQTAVNTAKSVRDSGLSTQTDIDKAYVDLRTAKGSFKEILAKDTYLIRTIDFSDENVWLNHSGLANSGARLNVAIKESEEAIAKNYLSITGGGSGGRGIATTLEESPFALDAYAYVTSFDVRFNSVSNGELEVGINANDGSIYSDGTTLFRLLCSRDGELFWDSKSAEAGSGLNEATKLPEIFETGEWINVEISLDFGKNQGTFTLKTDSSDETFTESYSLENHPESIGFFGFLGHRPSGLTTSFDADLANVSIFLRDTSN